MLNLNLALNGSNAQIFAGALYGALSNQFKGVVLGYIDEDFQGKVQPIITIKKLNLSFVITTSYQKSDSDEFLQDQSKPMFTHLVLQSGRGLSYKVKNQVVTDLDKILEIVESSKGRGWDLDGDDFKFYEYSEEQVNKLNSKG